VSAPAPRVFGRWSRRRADVRAVRDRTGDRWVRAGRYRWHRQRQDWTARHYSRTRRWWRVRLLAPLTEESAP
jgi:hypothetical protein